MKHDAGEKRGFPWARAALITVSVLLAAALAFCVFTINRAKNDADRLGEQIAAGQTEIGRLQSELQQASSDAAHQQSAIEQLQSGLRETESRVHALESDLQKKTDEAASYRSQASDLAARLTAASAAARPSAAKQSGSAPAPATAAVSGKTCYLTFDDGPSSNTLKILEILDRYQVKATFFVCGTNRLSYVTKEHAAGHTVALHSYTHDYSRIYSSQAAYFDDLNRISDAVYGYIGVHPTVMRFPGGSSNTVSRAYCGGIMSALTNEVRQRGYSYFDWNVDSWDATGNNVPVSTILSHVKSSGTNLKQAVVLMHDTDAKSTTVQALPQIIEYYAANGYTFAPITPQTPPVTHGVNN